MKPFIHAKNSVNKHGGSIEDYIEIHNFIDSSKIAVPDVRHRAVLHNAFGCFLVERIFGSVMTNSEGKKFSPRDIAEEHILEDLGFIPTLQDYFKNMPKVQWFGGPSRKTKLSLID